MIPKHIDEQMWQTLDEISDEVGHTPLNDNYILFFEGWSPECFPSYIAGGDEQDLLDYASNFAPKVWKEWDTKMRSLSYKHVIHGHDEHLGLYGVTYALYRRVK